MRLDDLPESSNIEDRRQEGGGGGFGGLPGGRGGLDHQAPEKKQDMTCPVLCRRLLRTGSTKQDGPRLPEIPRPASIDPTDESRIAARFDLRYPEAWASAVGRSRCAGVVGVEG